MILFMTEMWERFGYYLMVGIFFLLFDRSTVSTEVKGYNATALLT